jgi:single-strand DNA-binding protein
MPQLFGFARLGRDVEVRYTAESQAVANLALAFSYGKKGADGNRPTQWVDASLWGPRAESMAPFLLKSTPLCVTVDEVHVETFTRSDGAPGHKLVGRVINIEFAGAASRPEGQQAPAPRPAPQRAPAQAPARPAANLADMDDDIPF